VSGGRGETPDVLELAHPADKLPVEDMDSERGLAACRGVVCPLVEYGE
jgi:hypothetical protein